MKRIKATRRDSGRKGGLATLNKHGRGQLREWGKRGGRPPALTYDETRQQQRLERSNKNNEEVTGPPGSLSELQALYRLRRRSIGYEE